MSEDWDYDEYHHEYKLTSSFIYCCLLDTMVCTLGFILVNPNIAFWSDNARYEHIEPGPNFLCNYFWPLQLLIVCTLAAYVKLHRVKRLHSYPANRIPQIFFMVTVTGEYLLVTCNQKVFQLFMNWVHFFLGALTISGVLVTGFSCGKMSSRVCCVIGAAVPFVIFIVSTALTFQDLKFTLNVALSIFVAVLIVFEEAVTYLQLANPVNQMVVPLATRRKWECDCIC